MALAPQVKSVATANQANQTHAAISFVPQTARWGRQILVQKVNIISITFQTWVFKIGRKCIAWFWILVVMVVSSCWFRCYCLFRSCAICQVWLLLIRHNVSVNIVVLYLVWRFLRLSTSHNVGNSFANGHSSHHCVDLFVIFLTELEIENKLYCENACWNS